MLEFLVRAEDEVEVAGSGHRAQRVFEGRPGAVHEPGAREEVSQGDPEAAHFVREAAQTFAQQSLADLETELDVGVLLDEAAQLEPEVVFALTARHRHRALDVAEAEAAVVLLWLQHGDEQTAGSSLQLMGE